MTTDTLSAWLTQVKLPTGNFLRELMSGTLNWIMEEEVDTLIGARPQQRRSQRFNQRNGYRKRGWKTCVGYLELLIPKLRKGSCFPQFLKRRCLVEETLLGFVREAWVLGVSTRSMKRFAGALGTPNLSRSKGPESAGNSINGFKNFANARSRSTGCFSDSRPPI